MKMITSTKVGEMLGVTGQTVRAYHQMGWIIGTTRSGFGGRGQRLYFDPAEVTAFAEGGAPAAKAYRESQDVTRPKRGRKQVVV